MNGIVVLEMQNDFYDPESFIFVGEMAKAMIPNIQKLIKAARGMKVPLIYCNNTYIKDDYLYGKTPLHCFPGTAQYEIIDEVKPEEEDHIIPVYAMDAFLNSLLERILRSLKISRLFITGLSTDIGCLLTAMGAFQRGFEVYLISDCCATRSEEKHQMALNYLKPFTKVVTADEAIEKLTKENVRS